MGSTMLQGVRVVELAGLGPSPFAGMLLADLGADVVSVRRPGARATALTRGRPAVELDLKDERGREQLHQLLDYADVLTEAFRPGAVERLGLAPEDVQARHPQVVYARMTGWGQTGPRARTAGHDLTYIAVTGALHLARGRRATPAPPANLLGDFGGGGMYMVAAILAALLRRDRDGIAETLDISVLDGTTYLATMLHEYRAAGQWSDEPASNRLDMGAPYYDVYVCADGKHIAVAALEDPFFTALLILLEIGPLPFDRTDPATWPMLREMITAAVLRRTRDEWAHLSLHRDACVAPVLDLGEAAREPQVVSRGILQAREDGRGWWPSLPWGRAPEPSKPVVNIEDIIDAWGRD